MRLSCPIPSAVSSTAEEVNAATIAWCRPKGLPGAPRARFGFLAARCFPHADTRTLQLLADWIALFCAIDDAVEQAGPELAPELLSSWAGLLAGRPTDGAEDPVTRGCRDLAARLERDPCHPLFLELLDELFAAFVAERAEPAPTDVNGYLERRTVTAGVLPILALAGRDRADVLSDASRRAALLVGIQNDLSTWRREAAAGEGNNLVIVYCTSRGMAPEIAASAAASLHDAEMAILLSELEAGRGAALLGHVVRGHLDWATETGRYDPQGSPTPIRIVRDAAASQGGEF